MISPHNWKQPSAHQLENEEVNCEIVIEYFYLHSKEMSYMPCEVQKTLKYLLSIKRGLSENAKYCVNYMLFCDVHKVIFTNVITHNYTVV